MRKPPLRQPPPQKHQPQRHPPPPPPPQAPTTTTTTTTEAPTTTTTEAPFTMLMLDPNFFVRIVYHDSAYDYAAPEVVTANLEFTVEVGVFRESNFDWAWGAVCANNWDENDAKVVCRQIFGNSMVASLTDWAAFSVPVDPPVTHWMSNVQCTGQEQSLNECSFDGTSGTCNQKAGVTCTL
ncbi:lysyl oxidase homolog 2A-like [Amphiura filiformis]|uniref:lysyl oxidase homolog 2A-like n=1 Tax=Amphiura filiformis TaxID=82378 RepID=UPI003B214216